jgi:hypothetical protein
MYEMEGALFGLAAPYRPVTRLLRHDAPPAGARYPHEAPVSRLLPRSGVSPGRCPFPAVKVFLPCPRMSRKSRWPFISDFFTIHIRIHRTPMVIRTRRRLSTVYAQPFHRSLWAKSRCPRSSLRLSRSVTLA